MQTKVRRANEGDARAISIILLAAFEEYRSQYTPQGFSATTPGVHDVIQRLKEGPVWVAELQNELVGTAAAVLHESALYVRGMAVLPTGRGHGVGAALFVAIEDFAKEKNCQRLYLRTTPFLTRAIRLYTHLGFRLTDELPQDLFGTPLLTMEKQV